MRASRETAIVVAITLLPLILGASLAWVHDRMTPSSYQSGLYYLGNGMLGGQLFLVSLSLSGTNFSRLWDPQAPRVNFSGLANTFNVIGAVITAGLLGLDDKMLAFNFFPVNALSALFMIVAIFHYFCLAVPTYLEPERSDPIPEAKGRHIADLLEEDPE